MLHQPGPCAGDPTRSWCVAIVPAIYLSFMSLTPVLMFPQSARQRHGSFHVDKCTEVHISGDSCAQHEAMAGVSLMCISKAGSVQHTGAVIHSKQWGQLCST